MAVFYIELIAIIIFQLLMSEHLQNTQMCGIQNCQIDQYIGWSCYCSVCSNTTYLNRGSCCNFTTSNCSSCYSNSSQCDDCISNEYCLQSASKCSPCNLTLPGCITCTLSCYDCFSCNDSYFLNIYGKCELCSDVIDYCYSCSSNSTCLSCINNSYAINTTTYHCQNCSDLLRYCTNCSSSTQCNACVNDTRIIFIFSKCFQCQDIIKNCLTCTSISYCTQCFSLFAVVQKQNATACHSCLELMADCVDCSSSENCTSCRIGFVVNYGCSSVPGCIAVTRTSPVSVCAICNSPEFIAYPKNGICMCTVGHLAGIYCTQIIGCVSVVRKLSGDYCILCNMMLGFEFKNYHCKCKMYYELNGQRCQEICGDGVLYQLPCDDGNLIDGDGCSSSCQIEEGYLCNGFGHQTSVCIFKAKMKMALSCVYNLGGNTAKIVLSITPAISNFKKSNLNGLITFETKQNCTMANYSIVDSLLLIFINFEQDIQSKLVNITLKYDDHFFASPQSNLHFPLVSCNDNSLIYSAHYSSQSQNIKIIVKGICLLTLVAWIIGSLANKMIGVETLHTIQLIFIIQAFSPRYNAVLAYFSDLNRVLNGFQRLINSQLIDESFKIYYRLGYSQHFFQNMSFASSLLFFAVVSVFLIISIQRLCLLNGSQLQRQQKSCSRKIIQKTRLIRGFLYNVLIFPVIIGLYLNLVFSLLVNSSNNHFGMIVILFNVVLTSIVYFSECKAIILSSKNIDPESNENNRYVSAYLCSFFVVSFLASIAVSGISSKGVYILAAAESFHAVFVLLYRPYKEAVHTVGLIINQIAILLNCFWIVSQNYIKLDSQKQEIIALLLIGLILLCIFLSYFRSIFSIRSKSKNKQAKQLQSKRILNKQQIVKNILEKNQSQMVRYFAKQKLLKTKELQVSQGLEKNLNNFKKNNHLSKICSNKLYHPRSIYNQIKLHSQL